MNLLQLYLNGAITGAGSGLVARLNIIAYGAASEFDQTPCNRGQINLAIKINSDLRDPFPTSSVDL
jgi:hypothetical protein